MQGSESDRACVCRLGLIILFVVLGSSSPANGDSIDARSSPLPGVGRFVTPANSVLALFSTVPSWKNPAIDLPPHILETASSSAIAAESSFNPAPEPDTLLLLGTGLILIGIGFRRFIASKSPRPSPPGD